jgi:membrane-associated phospholipid phosphatase
MPRKAVTDQFRIWRLAHRHPYFLYAAACLMLGLCAFNVDLFLAQPDNLAEFPGDLKRVFDLSELFAHGFGIFLIVFGIWKLIPEKRRFLPRLLSCAILPSLTVQLVKLFFARRRPTAFLKSDGTVDFPSTSYDTWIGWLPQQELNIKYISQSFPSAHTATVVGLAIGMSWMFPRGKWLFFSIAVLASVQRITSLAHWTSDVFFGAAIAFTIAGAFIGNGIWGNFFARLERRHSKDDEPRIAAQQSDHANAA